MKKLLLSLSLLISFYSHSQTVASSCTSHDSIVKKYRNDADRLTLRREWYVNSTYKDSVVLQPSLRNSYMSALIAVYNATLLPIRDSIITLFNIHTKPDPELNTFTIKSSPANAWMQNLQNSIVPTGYQPIDNLIAKYHLQPTGYYQSTPYDVAVFTADSNYNMVALSHTAAAIVSVMGADPSSTFNDIKNISDSINPAFTLLTYSYGWGSCNDGCDFRSYWKFKVYTADCKVEYVGHSGDAISTETVGIKENSAFKDVSLYPNPAGETLIVKMASAPATAFSIEILNALGQTVLQPGLTGSESRELDVSSLKPGIYYVKLKNEQGSRVFKIIKE